MMSEKNSGKEGSFQSQVEEIGKSVERFDALVEEIRAAIEKVDIPDEQLETKAVSRKRLKVRILTRLLTGLTDLQAELPELRLNQFKGFKDFINFIKNLKEDQAISGYFLNPTGAGKTVLYGLFIKLLDLDSNVVLVPSVTLLEQTKDEFVNTLKINPSEIGIVGGGKKELGRKITLMTYHSYLDPNNRRKFDLYVCDEAHRSLGDATQAALHEEEDEDDISPEELAAEQEFFEKHAKESPDSAFLAFTATDTLAVKHVEDFFGPRISNTTRGDLIKVGVLKKYKVIQTEAEITPEEEVEKITKEKERNIISREKIYEKLLEKYTQFLDENIDIDLRTAVFCQTVDECKKFEKLAASKGFKSIIVTGKEGKDRQKEAEQKLLNGEIDFVITVDKLKEGWNFPALNAVIWARATGSPANIIQGTGRAARKYLDERFAFIFETQWKLSSKIILGNSNGGTGGKGSENINKVRSGNSNNALTLAQALAYLGEDPTESVEAYEGQLKYIRYLPIDELGEVKVKVGDEELELVSGSAAAAKRFGVSIITLNKRIEKAGIKPVEGLLGLAGVSTSVLLYRKKDVELLFPKQIVEVDEKGMAKVTIEDKEVEVVAPCAQAWAHYKTTQSNFNRAVTKAGLQAIPNIQARLTNANLQPFYLKSEIDKLLIDEYVADENGFVTVNVIENGVEEEVEAVASCERAWSYYQVANNTFTEGLKIKGIKPLEGIKVRTAKNRGNSDAYRKSDVEKVFKRTILVEVDENGFGKVKIGDEEVEVVASCDGACEKYSISKFPQTMERKGVKPLDGYKAKVSAAVNAKKVDVYRKSEVDAAVGDKVIGTDEFGMAVIKIDGQDVTVAATTSAFLDKFGKSPTQINYYRRTNDIQPVPGIKARDGNRKLDVYRYSDLKPFLLS